MCQNVCDLIYEKDHSYIKTAVKTPEKTETFTKACLVSCVGMILMYIAI